MDWFATFSNTTDVNVCYESFVNQLTVIYNQCFPLVRISRKAYKNKSWFTKELRNLLCEKNRLFKGWRKSADERDRLIYISFKKKYNNTCRLSKITYYRNVLDVKASSTKKIWDNLNSLLGFRAKSYNPNEIEKLIINNVDSLAHPLTHIFNLSLYSGSVPHAFKLAKVIPLFKKGDEKLPSNYRPISLLSIFNKVLEKLISKRLYNFFEHENIFYKYQYGFRKNHSTALSVLEVTDFCYANLDNNKYILGLFIDLQKAFDSIDIDILLSKLLHYGVRGIMFEWLKDYLHDRTQYTFVNGVKSKVCKINFGVPQGSVLGPLLFLIYVNDMYRATSEATPKLFADDTNLFIVGDNLGDLSIRTNKCLDEIYQWCLANKLTINLDKTNYTIFSPSRKASVGNINISIGNFQIQYTNCCKYLGILIDNKLDWQDHIDFIYKKLLKFCGIFYKIRDLLPFQCLKMVYFSFVHTHILYGIEFYAI